MTEPPEDAPLDLGEGRSLQLGMLTAQDRPLIQAAMARLSPESSRRRFFAIRRRLSERELEDLTTADPDRLAVGAVARWPDGRIEGVGIARYVRIPGTTDAAEVAVTVIDDYQNRGIGRRLLQRLRQEALRRGVRRLVGRVLEDNEPMLALLQRHAAGLVSGRDGDHRLVEVPLSAS